METNNKFGSDLAFALNVHERLVRDFPLTPYNSWCRWVHESSKSVAEKWSSILAWKVNPSEYENPTLFAADYQLYCLLSKFDTNEVSSDTAETTAYRKFRDTELRCSYVNDLLSARLRPSGLNALLHYTRKIVAECLGGVEDLFSYLEENLKPEGAMHEFERAHHCSQPLRDTPPGFNFGPGVSVSAAGRSLQSPVEKLEQGTVTPECWRLMKPVLQRLRLPRPTLVKGSVLRFVPKKVGEMRTICYEPSVNMLVQKPIGRYMRRMLKAYFGIDLRDQSRNQVRAFLGSLLGLDATIDLSSASDLNAYLLILEVLPPRWFTILDCVRSRGYRDPEQHTFHTFEKFSTMGNGFTFELETLVFAAVVLASIRLWGDPHFDRRDVVCYGDDICVPAQHYDVVVQGLTVIGHLPNMEKSFADGPFRESCGGDYFMGHDVTPLRIKEIHLEDPKTVINLHNRLFRHSRSPHHHSLIGLWCGSALGYISDWTKRHYPRVSGGREEVFWDRRKSKYTSESSDQWLWGWNGNNVWDFERQSMVPKFLCVEIRETVCEYHVPPSVAEWLIGLKSEATTLEKVSQRFVPNPLRFRPDRSKPVENDCTRLAVKLESQLS